ncbi:MAG: Gfo/Idh/MocA family oxidoreductase [Clostridia bacterium]|nr:Gfo/Idh/MocA family oxidoreductase [Clostridia bacterium]
MKEKIRIGFVGCGQFCRHFVPLFKAHPAVEYIAVCDKFPERSKDYKERFGADKIFDTYDEMVASGEVNTIAIFSQRNQHGEMAIKALKAGKNVYSAVPMATSIEEIEEIVRLVKETGLTYSMGETGIYRPASIFCRQKYAAGEIGDLVYAEAQYNHDMTGLYDVFKYTEGDEWRKMAGFPPFFYPTHSTSMVLSATKAHALKVAAFGYEDKMDTDIFGKDQNYWDNPFSNTSMLMKMSDDSIVRISENRRIAWHVPETYITSFNGTKASYECSMVQHTYVKMREGGVDVDYEDVSDYLNPIEMTKHKGEEGFMQKVVNSEWTAGEAPIQIVDRLPHEFADIKTGHAGTHKFMVDDFCQAYVTGKLSPTNAWQAARYNIPGLTAHKSAMLGGVTLDVLDLGAPPSEYEVLSEDRPENENNYDEYRKA